MSDKKVNHKNDRLNRLFDDPIKSDPETKKEAINLAMAAFDEEISTADQGFFQRLRLTFTQFFKGSNDMSTPDNNKPLTKTPLAKTLKDKLLYSGLVGFSVAAVGVFFIIDQSPDPLEGLNVSDGDYASSSPVVGKTQAPEPELAALDNNSIVFSSSEADAVSSAGSMAEQASEESVAGTVDTATLSSPPVRSAPAEKLAVSQHKNTQPAASRRRDEPARLQQKEARAISSAPVQLAESPKAKLDTRMGASDDVQHLNSVDKDKLEAATTHSVKQVVREPVSTFSIDVDTASYSHTRRLLNQGRLPQADAVRIEEMLNYFDYQYPLPESKSAPFKPTVVVYPAPWAEGKQLVHIGIKGFDLDKQQQPDSNLVLLLDVSGSMNSADKLPLVKQSMELLLQTLKPTDTVSIVVYAGASGQVLAPTEVRNKQAIINALKRLNAGGSTAGGQGIELAYALAEANFKKNSVNRIILATDGDFNVGIAKPDELKRLVERKRDQGVFLSVLGFGQGNYNDHIMQSLAQHGNGVATYIDSLSEAQKVLVDEATSTLFPIATDVKIQVEFNPKTVAEYRLIGYETRALKQADFNNDKVDAGDIGAGHSVTAIYEITPVGSTAALIDPSRYGGLKADKEGDAQKSAFADEYGFLKLRYKLPGQSDSRLMTAPITRQTADLAPEIMNDVNFATAVAAFGQLLRGGQYTGDYRYDDIIALAQASKGRDLLGYRSEFIQLVRKAKIAK